MNSQQFIEAGNKMIEYAAQYMEKITEREPLPKVEPGYLSKILPDTAPQTGQGFDAIFNDFEKVVMEGMSELELKTDLTAVLKLT